MTSSASHLQNSRMDNLIMAAEMQSNTQLTLAPFYLCPSPPIPTPKNKSELELYKLLEKANLIDYFPTFIKYGGDDVLQLAEANEEEFIEIVQLIGMNEKPLHVRRLQKALRQWALDRTEAMAIEGERRLAYLYDSGYRQTNTTTSTSATTPNRASIRAAASVSTAPSCTASPQTDNQASLDADTNQQQQPQYFAPHEIIRNVPKRLRLMDSIKPSDLTKGITMYDSSAYSTPVRPPWLKSRGLKLTRSSDSQQTTPIQISPPESIKFEDSDEDSDDNQNTGPLRNRRKRPNANLSKSK